MNKLSKLLLSLMLCVFCLEASCSDDYKMGPVGRFMTNLMLDAFEYNQSRNLVQEIKDTDNLLVEEEKGADERGVVVRKSREGFFSTLRNVSKTAFVFTGVVGVGVFSAAVIDKVAYKIDFLNMFDRASDFVADGIANGLKFAGNFVRNFVKNGTELSLIRPVS